MATKPKPGRYITNRDITQAMAACLRIVLEDLRTQYSQVLSKAERLKRAGGAVDTIYQELADLNERAAKTNVEKANPGRYYRRPRK